MKNQLDVRILYIRPKMPPSSEPVVDSITKKLLAAIKNYQQIGYVKDGCFIPNLYSFGCYKCTCGKAIFASQDFRISDALITNSVAVHYIAYHRNEIPKDELSMIEKLELEIEPENSDLELQ